MVGFEEFCELWKSVPIPCWLFASAILLSVHVSPASGVHEFSVYRMQHYDLHGVQYGSRSSLVNMEARGERASMLNRKCVLVRWVDLSSERLLDLLHRGAGSVLVLLPPTTTTSLGEEEEGGGSEESLVQEWRELESDLLSMEVPIPVYFATPDAELEDLFQRVSESSESERNSSAVAVMFSTLGDYGYQMMTQEQIETQPIKDPEIPTISGKLSGLGLEHTLPTIVLVAHYDATGLATSLSNGTDSNGSGVAALLELARLFSRLYSDVKQRPRYNLLFVLSGGGKLNYFGTKSFIEDQLDNPDSSLLPESEYTLCLDTLAPSASGLHLHVSRPPREGMRQFQLLQALNQSAQLFSSDFQVSLIHKKIRLSEDLLSWEHERFSIKRLPAATLSGLESHRDLRRRTMFTSKAQLDASVLARNVQVIADGLARYIFNLSAVDPQGAGGSVFPTATVHKDFLWAWLDFLSQQSRSAQLLTKDHPVVLGLEQALSRYTHDVHKSVHRPEKRDAEFVLYSLPSTTMQAYRVKPAIFDLLLAIGILAYAAIWYLIILLYPQLVSLVLQLPVVLKVRASKGGAKAD